MSKKLTNSERATVLHDIQQSIGLRRPLRESLDTLDQACQSVGLADPALPFDAAASTAALKDLFPASFRDFAHDFPSLAYSIATGVGKTRLMAAFLLYLYRVRGIRNFFILAPNLTIYKKLIRDFGDITYEKYVFRGVSEFVNNSPVVITADNYAQGVLFQQSEKVRINIFNIAKFNTDSKTSKKDGKVLAPRLKRLSEYLGQSYFEVLTAQHDLVILMDEAHRYRAEASRKAIEELRPLLGLELTATPFDAQGRMFHNVVYEYSLAEALQDGKYVKIPAVATRKNVNFDNLSREETDKLKLEDGISLHRDTWVVIQLYAREQGLPEVKPFVLVACSSIEHAKWVFDFVRSEDFYEGHYRDKTLQVDSSTKDDSDIEQLLTVERPANPIEIVIHVGMLKEGWDVNNLYTIVPLRASNSVVLVEQTLGRGLRLPFGGKRTGVEKVDMVTVVAHENFQKIVEAAQTEGSIYKKIKFVEFGAEDLGQTVEVVKSQGVLQTRIAAERVRVQDIKDEKQRQGLMANLDAKSMVISLLPTLNKNVEVRSFEDLKKPTVKAEAMAVLELALQKSNNLFAPSIVAAAKANYQEIVDELRLNIIPVPQFVVEPSPARTWFDDFDLDVSGFSLSKLDLEIERRQLQDLSKRDTVTVQRGASLQAPERMLMAKLLDYPEVDPDEYAELRFKLCQQAAAQLRANAGTEKDVRELVFDRLGLLAEKIYEQLMEHFHVEETGFRHSKVLAFTRVEPWNFSVYKNYGRKHFRETIRTVAEVPKYLYYGFQKSCHLEYKFQSKAEKDFSIICEEDAEALHWMRPARNQFKIYWNRRHDLYQPDFIVETEAAIYLVETKSRAELDSEEVKGKTVGALGFCRTATEFNAEHGGKPWHYLLIPHNDVVPMQKNLRYFAKTYTQTLP